MKHCTSCGEDKESSEFHKASKAKDGLYSHCKKCANASKKRSRYKLKKINGYHGQSPEYRKKWRQENPELVKAMDRRADLKRKYGITIEDYEAMLI